MALEAIKIHADCPNRAQQIIEELKDRGLYKGDEYYHGAGEYCKLEHLEKFGTARFDPSKLTRPRHQLLRDIGVDPSDTVMVGLEDNLGDYHECDGALQYAKPYLVVYDPAFFESVDDNNDELGLTVVFKIQEDRRRAIKAVFEIDETPVVLPEILTGTVFLCIGEKERRKEIMRIMHFTENFDCEAERPSVIESIEPDDKVPHLKKVTCQARVLNVRRHSGWHHRFPDGKIHRFTIRGVSEGELDYLKQVA